MNEIFGFHRKLVKLHHQLFGEEEQVWCMSSYGYFGVVKASSISSSLRKQQRDRSDGLSMEEEMSGLVELDIM